MRGALYQYLADDHKRLGSLLQRAVAKPGQIDTESYHEFRKGLLRHISMEEKIVLPSIARWQGGKKPAMWERLRLDHGALVALLAPAPTPSIMLTIQSILEVHNELEEQKGGLYELLEQTAGPETEQILVLLNSAPPVAVLPNNDKPEVF
jgi:Hemerythrin HHE cation binding domain